MGMLLYNPDRKNKDQLIAEFVVRNEIYNEIMEDLESSSMQHPEQHYLIVGQRGTGKTTLLNRIKFGVEDNKRLKALIPVIFSEEQYHITDLGNLWENIGNFLEDFHGFDGISKEIEQYIDKKDFEERAFDVVEKHLNKHKKKIVLLLDNLGDLLKKLKKSEIHRFREILQTRPELRLIAGTPFYLEATIDYHQPFYEFFKIIHLEGLNQQETERLLLKLGDIHNEREKIASIINETPERIAVLRMLTGGVPRTIALMFKIFINSNDESSIQDLEQILDAVTPLYKHRMDDLPAQQQKIVHAVAINWDAISVKELKNKVRIEGKAISAQLTQLEKNQVIQKIETNTKNHLYIVRERFFNIWYLMRYGRKDDKQKVIWLVRFLESWCSKDDLKERIFSFVDKIKNNKLDEKTAAFFGHVYVSLKGLDIESKVQLKVSTPNNIASNVIFSLKELEDIIAKKSKVKAWADILNLVHNQPLVNDYIKNRIFACLIELSIIDFIHPLIKETLEKVKKISLSEPSTLTPTELEIFKNVAIQAAFLSIHSNSEKTVDIIADYITVSKNDIERKSSAEKIALISVFLSMLSNKQYNLLATIFSETKQIELKEIFKPVYYALIYLKTGPESTEYLKAGPELQESIKSVLYRVQSFKKK